MNPNDEIRDAILRHLHSVHAKASSPRSASIKVSDLHKAMRELGYTQQPTGQQINVTTINGVTVVGDKNVVNTRYADLSEHLEGLRSLVLSSPEIGERDKLDGAADIDTIRSQLQKPEPDAGLISRAWSGIERVATAGGAVDAVQKIAPLIQTLG